MNMKAMRIRRQPHTSTGARSKRSSSSRCSLVGVTLFGVSLYLHMLPPVTTSFQLGPATITSRDVVVSPPPDYHYHHLTVGGEKTKRSSSPLFSVATSSSSTLSPPGVKELTKQEIQNIQAKAEQDAIENLDSFAMNALFVNIPERPTPQPCTILNCDGAGGGDAPALPSDLPPGCLLRIGPNGASKEDGFLDGDGMIHCITLPPSDSTENKQPMYTATYVQTNGRVLEEEMAKVSAAAQEGGVAVEPVKFKGTLGAAPNGWPMLKNLVENGLNFQTLRCQKDTCNTAMALSGKRILALMEQSRPSEISVSKDGSIETLGSMLTLDGVVTDAPITGGNFGAHGRTDATTGERVHVSYNSNEKPFVRVDAFDDNWALKSSWGVDVPAPIMVHDCAMSSKYVIICDFPLTIRPKRFIQNQFPVEYEPDHGARIGLSPREGNGNGNGNGITSDESSRETLWFDVEPGVVLHLVNAYDRDDGTVVIHGYKAIPKKNASYILEYTPPFLHEWVIDPTSNKVLIDRCLNPKEAVEFPAIDDRDVGTAASYCYGVRTTGIGSPLEHFATPNTGILLDEVLKFSLLDSDDNKEDKEKEGIIAAGDVIGRYMLPAGWHYVSEPTVVSKTSGNGHYVLLIATEVPEEGRSDYVGTAEFALNENEEKQNMKSQLIVLDGDNISQGPVCTVQLPSHMNYGLHSLFVPWDCLK